MTDAPVIDDSAPGLVSAINMTSRGVGSESDMPPDLMTTLQGLMETQQGIQAALVALNATLEAQKPPAQQPGQSHEDQPKSTFKSGTSHTQEPPGKLGQSEEQPESSQSLSEAIKLDPQVVEMFCLWIAAENCEELIKMIDDEKHPAQLILEANSDNRTALHVAASNSSAELLAKLSSKRSDILEHGSKDMIAKASDFPFKVLPSSGLTAIDMALLVGNEEILLHMQNMVDSLNTCMSICAFPVSDQEQRKKRLEIEEQRNKRFEIEERLKSVLNETSGLFNLGMSWAQVLHKFSCGMDDSQTCLHLAAKVPYECSPDLGGHDEKVAVPVGCAFLERVFEQIGDPSLLASLLAVKDRQGKTPLHICMEIFYKARDYTKEAFLEKVVSYCPHVDLNVRDFIGRTPLHWAAAQGLVDQVTTLLKNDKTDLNAVFDCDPSISGAIFIEPQRSSAAAPDHYKDFNIAVFKNVTPLHLATINNHADVVEQLLKVRSLDPALDVNKLCETPNYHLGNPVGNILENADEERWTSLQLAAHLGHVQILQLLLEDSRTYDPGMQNYQGNVPDGHNGIPALHIAAARSHPFAINALVDSVSIDVFTRDKAGNTALHYSTTFGGENLEIHANIYNYVNCEHFSNDRPKPMQKCSEDDIITCMDILMQSGLDMHKKNENGVTPTLPLSTPPLVHQMWLKKMASEAQETKTNMNTAASAISVTAALVLTISFAGPLQPPLGLSSEANPTWLTGYSQVNHVAVEVFLICDCFSFYLAIASIMFALLPALSIPHEGIWHQVQIARRCVQLAVLLLFGSMTFIICAFSAASIAIMPERKWLYKGIAVMCISLGALLCSSILSLSFFRLLKLFPTRSERMKKMSDKADSVLLWEALPE